MNSKYYHVKRRLFSTLLILCLMLGGWASAETGFSPQPVIKDQALTSNPQPVANDELLETAPPPDATVAADATVAEDAATEAASAEADAAAEDLPEPASEAPYEGLEVYFLDLGRVDGILIRCGGENCFIDVGFKENARPAVKFLKAMGISHLNSYVGTHGHFDHIEGAPEIIDAFRPDRMYFSHLGAINAIIDCADAAQQEVIADTEKVILQPGDTFNVGDAVMTALGPLKVKNVNTGNSGENDNSLILRLDYGHRSFLFTADTTDKILRAVNAQFPGKLNVDVFKNPHHNGAHDEDVIDMIRPAVTVFCTDDGHQPTKAYQSLLAAKGSRVYITGPANQGNVAIVSDGQSLEMRCGYSVKAVALASVPRLHVGQDYDLEVTVDPADALIPQTQLGWNSSDPSIIQVYNGRVRAMGEGRATVTATAVNGVSGAVEVECWRAYVTLDQAEMSLAVGQTKKLGGKITPANAKGVSGTWLSEDERVATVEGGKVTGVGEGVTRVVARLSNGAEAACTVTVRGKMATSVKLDRQKAEMKVGDNLTLAATVEPDDFNADDLEWYSSDESILWVDQSGNITAVRPGKAKIAVVASEGVYDVCVIRVK